MLESTMQSPLFEFDLRSQARAIDESRGVWANEIPLLGYLSLRGDARAADFPAAVERALGAPLPLTPCTIATAHDLTLLWMSPDEWMVICPRSRLRGLEQALALALTGMRHQVVDNSGGYTQVFLTGRNALDVLKHASVYDFASLAPGRVVGTTFGKSAVYAYCDDEGFHLLLRRSFADYIWRYLVRVAGPYGLGIAAIEASGHAGHGVAE